MGFVCLFGLRLYISINIFSAMSGRFIKWVTNQSVADPGVLCGALSNPPLGQDYFFFMDNFQNTRVKLIKQIPIPQKAYKTFIQGKTNDVLAVSP